MINKPKAKGTSFETKAVKFFQSLGHKAERIALAGAKDCGDIHLIDQNRVNIIVECKSYERFTMKQLEQWIDQARTEAKNWADAHPFDSTGGVVPALAVKANGANAFWLTTDLGSIPPLQMRWQLCKM